MKTKGKYRLTYTVIPQDGIFFKYFIDCMLRFPMFLFTIKDFFFVFGIFLLTILLLLSLLL